MVSISRAVARSENPGGLVVLGGDNVPPLVEIGLADLPKTGGPSPLLATALNMVNFYRSNLSKMDQNGSNLDFKNVTIKSGHI